MARPTLRRGLQIMRTQSTRKAGSLSSPEMYIRLTSLEMERARRVLERERLQARIQILDERIDKIAEEQAEMRSRIDELDRKSLEDESSDARYPRQNDAGFGFTY